LLTAAGVYPFIQGLSLSVRSLRRSPGFTAAAVLNLTLGLAGVIVVFSLVNATLLRPLPYPEPHRLMVLRWQDQSDISAPAFFMVREHAGSFSSVAAFYPVNVGVNISTGGEPQYVKALSVSKGFFQTLATRPELGNIFSAEDDEPNAPGTTVLSYGLWTQQFGRDPSVIGRPLQANGEIYKIIGIMPKGFRSYPDADLWFPLQLNHASTDATSNCRVIVRLAAGSSRQQSRHELEEIAREYHVVYPWSAQQGRLIEEDMQGAIFERERSGLSILFAAVGLAFLIACTNVAMLILVRGTGKAQAIAIRAALGPTRRELVLSLVAESMVLSLASALLGLILAKESLPLVLLLRPADLPLAGNLVMDTRIVLFALAMSLLGPLIFGLAPALRLSRVNIAHVLAHASRTVSASNDQLSTVRLLVLGQIALTVMLLAGTMLLGKTLLNLYSVSPGFDPSHVLVAQISLTGDKYRTTRSTEHLLDETVKQLRALPKVDSVAALNGLPLEKSLNLPVHPIERPSTIDHADEYRLVTPDYFHTLRMHMRSGRQFNATDIAGSTPVAIINEALAHRWWPESSPLGQMIKVDEEAGPKFNDVPRQIVGVVSDTLERGLAAPPPPTIFVPITQTPDNITAFSNNAFLTSIIVRSSQQGDLALSVRKAIQSVDPSLPLASVRSFSQVIDHSLAAQRFMALLTAAFSLFALVLTVIGIHGLLSYQAGLRSSEIAIRIAVGASRTDIVRMVVQQGTRPICFAVLLGLAGAFLVKNLLKSFLYGAQSSSLILILATGLLLGITAALINLLTAIRAASIDPIAVLRNE
jgi:putative ABC transport system permease protein